VKSENVKTVVFDFDYTLADSSQGVVECVGFALSRLGLPPVSPEAIRPTIGLSLTDTLHRLTGIQDATLCDAFARRFVERADEVMVDCTRMFDYVGDMVASLRRSGRALGIASTKFAYRIRRILERDGLKDCFDVVVGGEMVSRHKPDPEALLCAIKELGGATNASLYVGDSVTDAETARRAMTPFVAVLSGVTPRQAFTGYSVEAVLDDASQLPRLLGC
jgi:phosphoglycolate phosphatase